MMKKALTRQLMALMALAAAGVLLLSPPAAWAQGATPTGQSPTHPCLRGEGNSAPIPGGHGTCYNCTIPPTTPSVDHGGTKTPAPAATTSDGSVPGPTSGGGHWDGTRYWPAGSSPEPGGGGGLDAHSGSYTAVIALPSGSASASIGCIGAPPARPVGVEDPVTPTPPEPTDDPGDP